ncbi:MAG: hypothetical protein MZV64_73320 [Ignavibacteriales bacterium]|nr:hypothetical protein [Ignavibacteriales bacterium]
MRQFTVTQQRREGHRRRRRSRWSPGTSPVSEDGKSPRHDVPGAVVLPEARGAADHRGRHPAHAWPKTCTWSCRPTS